MYVRTYVDILIDRSLEKLLDDYITYIPHPFVNKEVLNFSLIWYADFFPTGRVSVGSGIGLLTQMCKFGLFSSIKVS